MKAESIAHLLVIDGRPHFDPSASASSLLASLAKTLARPTIRRPRSRRTRCSSAVGLHAAPTKTRGSWQRPIAFALLPLPPDTPTHSE